MNCVAKKNFDELARRIRQEWPELVLIGRFLVSSQIPHSIVGIYFDGPNTKSNRGIYRVARPLSSFYPYNSMELCLRLVPRKDGVTVMDAQSVHYVDFVYDAVKTQVIPFLEQNRKFEQVMKTVQANANNGSDYGSWVDFPWAWYHLVGGDFDNAVKCIKNALALAERINLASFDLQKFLATDRFAAIIRCKELIEQGNPAAVADFLRSLERAKVAGYKFEKYYKPTVFPFER